MNLLLLWELFREERDRAFSEQVMSILLELQTIVNMRWLRQHPETPPLYETGVRYSQEGRRQETWQAIPVIVDTADCEDLSCWRAAELRVSGEDPACRVVFRGKRLSPHRTLYHVQVLRGDGTIEDPSRKLGMGQQRRRWKGAWIA